VSNGDCHLRHKPSRMRAETEDYIKFLGTAGARFVVARQLRASGGVFIRMMGKSIILDPGPGTLARCARSRPPVDLSSLDAIIVTHTHIDHSTDVNVLIDAMTDGGLKRRGVLFAPNECIHGEDAVVLRYLRSYPRDIVVLEANRQYQIEGLCFSTSRRHLHPAETYGLIFDLHGRRVSFMVDTRYFPELVEDYRASDVLVMNVVRYDPHPSAEVMHLCVDDVRRIVSELRPRLTVLTHFGMTMLKAKPWQVGAGLTQELGVEVIAASDGMTVGLE